MKILHKNFILNKIILIYHSEDRISLDFCHRPLIFMSFESEWRDDSNDINISDIKISALNLGQFLSKKFCSNFERSLLRVNLKFKSNFGISKFPKVLGIKQKKELSVFNNFEESYGKKKKWRKFAAPCTSVLIRN